MSTQDVVVPWAELAAELARLTEHEESGLKLRTEVLEALRMMASEPPIPVFPNEPVKALYVDDSEDDQFNLHRVAVRSGLSWNWLRADSFKEAAEALDDHDDIDLLFLDYELVGCNGLDVLEHARKSYRHDPCLPAIVLSTRPFKELRDLDPRLAWATCSLPKSQAFHPDVLESVTCTALAHAELARRRHRLQLAVEDALGVPSPSPSASLSG